MPPLKHKKLRVILSGGGTGGHIYPAISIAQRIQKDFPEATILFVGARSKMEMEKVPLAGFKIIGLPISGLQRRKIWANRFLFFKVVYSTLKYLSITLKFKPHLVIGTGGYASTIPLAVSSILPNIKTVILELNAYAGLSNRLLAKRADLICVSHLGMQNFFPPKKIRLTGVPVREDIYEAKSLDKNITLEKLGLNPSRKTIFLVGGSLGSAKMNEIIASSKDQIIAKNWQLIWQTGRIYYTSYRNLQNPQIKVKAFLDNMKDIFAICDVVISRAGASIISEISEAAKPSILIPSPNVAENHQLKNALYLSERDAALLIEERDLTPELFINRLSSILDQPKKAAQLSQKISNCLIKDGTKNVVGEIQMLLGII